MLVNRGFFSRKIFKAMAVIAVFGAVAFLVPERFFYPVRTLAFGVTYPFQRLFSGITYKISGWGEFIGSIGKLKQENEALTRDNQALRSQNAMLQGVENENEILRRELKLLPRSKFSLATASVIGLDADRSGSWVLVDKGLQDGVESGMAVIVSDGILVGKVGDVYDKSAQVVLLTNPGSAINALTIANQSKGIVRGKYGLGLMFDMVLQTDSLNEGEDVITSGIGERIPQGLLVGRVQDVKLSQDGLYQQATVLPYIKSSEIHIVSIIKESLQ